MPIYNFQQRFAPYVQDGSKPHTIRAIRKHPAHIGDTLYLYTGLRQSGAKRLIEPTPCTAVNTIFIFNDGRIILVNAVYNAIDAQAFLEDHNTQRKKFLSKYKLLTQIEKNKLCFADGFRYQDNFNSRCFELFIKFWKQTHQLPFAGHIIVWHPQPEKLSYLNLKV